VSFNKSSETFETHRVYDDASASINCFRCILVYRDTREFKSNTRAICIGPHACRESASVFYKSIKRAVLIHLAKLWWDWPRNMYKLLHSIEEHLMKRISKILYI